MPRRVVSKVEQYRRIVAGGSIRPVFQDLSRWAWSKDRAVGMSRDLTVPFDDPEALVPFEIAPLDETLAARLFSEDGVDGASLLDLESRRRFWRDRLPGAYVAVAPDGTPYYVQWAISGDHAERVKGYFGDGFPRLAENELLLEGAWARPEARGKRIMAAAMSRITVTAARPGDRRAITFVGVDNEPSIRGCRAAGYEVYVERQERWRFGKRTVTWADPGTNLPSAPTTTPG